MLPGELERKVAQLAAVARRLEALGEQADGATARAAAALDGASGGIKGPDGDAPEGPDRPDRTRPAKTGTMEEVASK